jgi:O-methyltransferase domain
MTSLVTTDLQVVEPVATKWIQKWGTQDRVQFVASDCMTEEFPHADIVTMGMILHDWNLDIKRMLIRKAYDALPKGGALIAIETIIDDERRSNTPGLCMSLNMLLEFGAQGGFDFTHADFNKWCLDVGFERTEILPLAGSSSAVIAHK